MKIYSLITICDFNYIDNFDNFLKSYILNETNDNIKLNHFYIYDKEEDIIKFKEKFNFLNNYNNIIIHYIKYPKDYKYPIKIFSCHYRFNALKLLIDKYDILIYTE